MPNAHTKICPAQKTKKQMAIALNKACISTHVLIC